MLLMLFCVVDAWMWHSAPGKSQWSSGIVCHRKQGPPAEDLLVLPASMILMPVQPFWWRYLLLFGRILMGKQTLKTPAHATATKSQVLSTILLA